MRLGAIAALAATLWPLDLETLRLRWRWLAGAAAVYLVVLLQLVPLPPAVWAALPGHAVYARVAAETDSVGWRPLSLTPDLTLNALLALLPATAMGVCALHLDSRARARLADSVVLAACASAGLGLVQLATGGGFHLFSQTGETAIGLFANQNHQAAFLSCALPLTGAIAGRRTRDWPKPLVIAIALAISAFLLIGVTLTGSRMGLVLGGIGAAGAIWCYRAGGNPIIPLSWPLRLALAAGVVAMLAGFAFTALRGGAIDRLASGGLTDQTRVAMFGPLLGMAQAFMPLGAGFGSFDAVYRHFEPSALLSTIYMNEAHDEPLQLAIEGGLPALVLLGVFLVWWTRTAVRRIGLPLHTRRRGMGDAAAVVTVILMASSLVDYPLRTPLLGALFAFACVEMLCSTEAGSPSIGRNGRS